VGFSSRRIPSPVTGRRGVEGVAGLVIARRWELDRGRGTLTLMVSDDQIAGYAPSAFCDIGSADVSNISGFIYEISFELTDESGESMAQSGISLDNYFPAGSRVELLAWDSSTVAAVNGEVVGPATTIGLPGLRIDFVSNPFGPLASDQLLSLRYAPYDDVGLLVAQRRYAYLADTDSTLDSGSGTEPAKRYS
jgi:hypothetical protein